MASNDLSSTSNTLDTTFAFHKMSYLHPQQNDSVTAKPHGLESESYSWNSVAGEGNKYQDSLSGDSVYQTQISCSEPSRETPARSQLSDAAAFHGQARLNVLGGAVPNQKRLGRHQKASTDGCLFWVLVLSSLKLEWDSSGVGIVGWNIAYGSCYDTHWGICTESTATERLCLCPCGYTS